MNTAVKSTSENASGITRSSLVGWAMSGLVIAFCLMDGTMNLFHPQVVVDATKGIGWPADPATLDILGVILLASTVLYAFPRTAVLGAILLTGYLGGAVASHARLGDPLLTHTLFGVYVGCLAWCGLWFRDARIRALIP
jgi:hypothetical protein